MKKSITVLSIMFSTLGLSDALAYAVGDLGPTGGRIFYVDDPEYKRLPEGVSYLEAAPDDLAVPSGWSNVIDKKVGSTSTELGSGPSNTKAIISQISHTSSAAKLCDDYEYNGFNDWFLPSLEELYFMRLNLAGLDPNYSIRKFYWSSSEFDERNTWYQRTSDGNEINSAKDLQHHIRCIRAF